jgi:hypothetical protein
MYRKMDNVYKNLRELSLIKSDSAKITGILLAEELCFRVKKKRKIGGNP